MRNLRKILLGLVVLMGLVSVVSADSSIVTDGSYYCKTFGVIDRKTDYYRRYTNKEIDNLSFIHIEVYGNHLQIDGVVLDTENGVVYMSRDNTQMVALMEQDGAITMKRLVSYKEYQTLSMCFK